MNKSRFLKIYIINIEYQCLKWDQLLVCLENEDLSNASGQGNYNAVGLSTVGDSRVLGVPLVDLNKV